MTPAAITPWAQFRTRTVAGSGGQVSVTFGAGPVSMAAILAELAPLGATYNLEVPPDETTPPSRSSASPRILGLDVGARRIGLAISDPLGITAQGLETLHRQNKRRDFEELERVIRKFEVTEIVVGNPLRMSGATGTQSEKVGRFAEELRARFQLPVHLWDERLTSAEANRLLRSSEMSIKRRGEVVDRLAAVLILQSWMEARGR
jgi:putative pre-16S rRNA nuclease